jgi:hypothetical protein
MFKVPNEYRFRDMGHPLGSDDSIGTQGAFFIPIALEGDDQAIVIASCGLGWEHVSVHIGNAVTTKMRTPSWDEMCKIKDMFWGEEDCVVQYHPPKSEYVNQHEFTLHLWRPTKSLLPVPDSLLVGLKKS